jgi:transcriptional regulator with GAF, ATPase, and Fis domain
LANVGGAREASPRPTVSLERNDRFERRFPAIAGRSAAVQSVLSVIEKVAPHDTIVLIRGESGTGKELVAEAIHHHSTRANKPIVKVNCGALVETLLLSELFGHERGAFTDAREARPGLFEMADGGTIFLDEIAEMDISLQAKILRVLQEKELSRVGGNENVKINCRVIVATNRNLKEEVTKGGFREDLYYRLLGLPVQLPPLRERKSDIPVLAKHFVNEFIKENKLPNLKLSKEALDKLANYYFPGNVRELKAVVELACVMTNALEITDADIHFQNDNEPLEWLQEELTLRDFERKLIRYYLDKYQDNVITVANKLDIGKSTIYRMLQNQEL